MVKRINPTRRTSVVPASPSVEQLAWLAPPPMLAGEDRVAFDTLLARICAAVKPKDVIEELYIHDVITLEWEILRWRRLKTSLIQQCGLGRLKCLLEDKLDFEHYEEHALVDLTGNLHAILPEDQSYTAARSLAKRVLSDDPDAVDEVAEMLEGEGIELDHIYNGARATRAKELAEGYANQTPTVVEKINEILAPDDLDINALIANGIIDRIDANEQIDYLSAIERIDRLESVAVGRRNASLREIHRHRTSLGTALRRHIEQVEDGEFEVIETKQNSSAA